MIVAIVLFTFYLVSLRVKPKVRQGRGMSGEDKQQPLEEKWLPWRIISIVIVFLI